MTAKHVPPISAVPVVLFGVDGNGKPKAARFAEKQADLATKAAEQLKLRVLPVTNPQTAELAARLPAGRIHANGRGFVPFIRRDLFAKLLAAAGASAQPQNGGAAAAASAPSAKGSGSGSGRTLPRSWDELAPGHLVVAQQNLEDGWYEAVVIERSGDMLMLRWHAYPRERSITRHYRSVALLYANGASPVGAKPAAPAQSGKGKNSPPSSAPAAASYPQTWTGIDVGHLVLAKEDGPAQSWWEAIPIEKAADDAFTLRWRDHTQLPTIVRQRLRLALLHPAP
jgi:hypothetical protein